MSHWAFAGALSNQPIADNELHLQLHRSGLADVLLYLTVVAPAGRVMCDDDCTHSYIYISN